MWGVIKRWGVSFMTQTDMTPVTVNSVLSLSIKATTTLTVNQHIVDVKHTGHSPTAKEASNMEILISVPPFLHPLVVWLGALWLRCQDGWVAIGHTVTASQDAFRHVMALPYSNVFLPIVGILLVFWPILLSLVMAIASAWAWILWLITSMLLGFKWERNQWYFTA